MSDLVGNPEDRFSQNEAHFIVITTRLERKPRGCEIGFIFNTAVHEIRTAHEYWKNPKLMDFSWLNYHNQSIFLLIKNVKRQTLIIIVTELSIKRFYSELTQTREARLRASSIVGTTFFWPLCHAKLDPVGFYSCAKIVRRNYFDAILVFLDRIRCARLTGVLIF